jgi:hypothetical protein
MVVPRFLADRRPDAYERLIDRLLAGGGPSAHPATASVGQGPGWTWPATPRARASSRTSRVPTPGATVIT